MPMQNPPEGIIAVLPHLLPRAVSRRNRCVSMGQLCRSFRLLIAPALLCALSFPTSVSAWFSESTGNAASPAMPSVALNPAARPGGLAGAYTAVGSGPTALGVNPAALATDSSMVYVGSVRPDLARIGAVAVSFPGLGGQWAVSATYVDFDEILATDENQNAQGALRPFHLYPALSYAQALGNHWRLGATIKLARESLGDFEGSTPAYGAGVDAGLQYQASRQFGFGASITNLGRQVSGYSADDDRRGAWPVSVRGGFFYQPPRQRQLMLIADVEAPAHASPSMAVATEYVLLPEWILRAGTRWSAEDIRNLWGIIDPNAGIEERGGEAVKVAAGTTVSVGPVAVDYAAQWWRELGVVHALTLTWSMGR